MNIYTVGHRWGMFWVLGVNQNFLQGWCIVAHAVECSTLIYACRGELFILIWICRLWYFTLRFHCPVRIVANVRWGHLARSTSSSAELSTSLIPVKYRVTHICVGKLTIIVSDNGLSPGRRQAIMWTNAGVLLIGPLGTNSSEILIGNEAFHSRKCIWKCRNGVHFVSASMC